MAVTVTQTPSAYTPAYNPQWFRATSTQELQPNFKYTIVVTDLITTQALVFQVNARPGGGMIWDAMPFTEARIENYLPQLGGAIFVNGWQVVTGGLRRIKVNIGETYGTTPVYHAGTDQFYYIWNSAIDRKTFSTYNYLNYLYDNSAGNRRYFAGVLSDITYEDRSNFLYALTEGAGDLTSITVNTFNAAGSLIGTSFIANPYASSGTYTDKYVCIDIGHRGLSGIPSGLVTGTYPIITPAVASYQITDTTGGANTIIKNFTVGCSQYAVSTIHYLARNGAFLSCNFDMISDAAITKDTTFYNQNPNSVSSGVYGYTTESSEQLVMDVTVQDTVLLRTKWLTEEQIRVYQDCFTASKWFLQDGESRIRGVSLVPGTYRQLPMYNDKLVMLEFQFKFNYQDHAQRP